MAGIGSSVSSHARSLPPNSGMCVLDPDGPQGRKCLDMCDYKNGETLFSGPGSPPESWATVQSVRAGNDGIYSCPRVLIWPWILGILLCCCLSAILGIVYVKFCKDRFAGPSKKRALQEPRQFVPEAPPEQMVEERSLEPPPLMAPPPQDVPPAMPAVESQPPPPMASHWQGPIPGMDQPLLTVPGVQPVYTPQTTAQVADPSLIAQATPIMTVPSMTQAYRQPMTVLPSYASQPAVVPNAFSTQPQLASQPGSMAMAYRPY